MAKSPSLFLAAIASLMTVPAALAADVERNDRLYDAEGAKVAKVNSIADDGDILLIYKGKVRRIDASTLSNTNGKLMTTLTRTEIRRLK